MKNKASLLWKQMLAMLGSIAKSKSMAIKNKTSAAKARLIMFSLMKSKKFSLLGGSLSNKINSLLGHDEKEDTGDQSKAIVLYNEACSSSCCTNLMENEESNYGYGYGYGFYDDDDKYPDLRHSLFDEDDDFGDDQGGSIIDLVKNSKEEGEDFSLEDEIDHVADLFIKRFHKQMRLQKLESFKRYQEMLARGV